MEHLHEGDVAAVLVKDDVLRVDRIPYLGLRLRAARLSSGIITYGEAAAALGIPMQIYRAVETGVRGASLQLVETAAAVFNVSRSFILHNEGHRDADRRARLLLAQILVLDADEWSEQRVVAGRLKDARRDAGFRSSQEAIERFGWKTTTYQAHESGLRAMSTDRLVLYALALGVDARRIAFDPNGIPPEGSLRLTYSIGPDADAEEIRYWTGTPWPWLVSRQIDGGGIEMPVLRPVSGVLVVDVTPLVLPAAYAHKLTGSPDDVFALDPDGSATSLLVLRREAWNSSRFGFYAHDGLRAVELGLGTSATRGDPLLRQGTDKLPLLLGRFLGRLRFD